MITDILKKQVSHLTVDEKYDLADMLWHDLQQYETKIPIPLEHKQLLDARLDKIDSGNAVYFSVQQVREELNLMRDAIHHQI